MIKLREQDVPAYFAISKPQLTQSGNARTRDGPRYASRMPRAPNWLRIAIMHYNNPLLSRYSKLHSKK